MIKSIGLKRVVQIIVFSASIPILIACSNSDEYMEAYNKCRSLPGNETVKAQLCSDYAELSEREMELEAKLLEVQTEKLKITQALIKP